MNDDKEDKLMVTLDEIASKKVRTFAERVGCSCESAASVMVTMGEKEYRIGMGADGPPKDLAPGDDSG